MGVCTFDHRHCCACSDPWSQPQPGVRTRYGALYESVHLYVFRHVFNVRRAHLPRTQRYGTPRPTAATSLTVTPPPAPARQPPASLLAVRRSLSHCWHRMHTTMPTTHPIGPSLSMSMSASRTPLAKRPAHPAGAHAWVPRLAPSPPAGLPSGCAGPRRPRRPGAAALPAAPRRRPSAPPPAAASPASLA